ncbi:hypothetical protein A3860_39580 [Niastella vici]|uniref:Trimeric autotransporter adhesin YadA-like head domain-containing protein n=1 Tax=Niastella vici TaxID=1703345 RepID=A0A1V9FHV2_9BACT|nr:hypothetical protein [Niastella vici]OQP57958.1 hypothetical protein A3860_39580 [Niastella vici]
MKKIIMLMAFICLGRILYAQQPYVYTIKADSVKITNTCDTAELIIENHTQNVPGFLYNKGKGRTEFRRATRLNDSTIVIGGDTLLFRGNPTANNGLSMGGRNVQLGQSVGAAGNPAALLDNREIPMNGFNLSLSGTGKFIAGRTTNDGVGLIQNAGSYSYDRTDSNGIYAGSVRMLGQKASSTTAIFGLGNSTNISAVSSSASVIALGPNTGNSITSGYNSVILGFNCGNAIVSPFNFYAIGNSCLTNSTGTENLAIGNACLYSNTTGVFNNAVGESQVLKYSLTGIGNNAFGTNAGNLIKTGNYNVCIGHDAGGGNYSFPGSEATECIFISPRGNTAPAGIYTNCLFVGEKAGKQTSNAATSITNSGIIANNVTTDLDNVFVISNISQRVILPSSSNIVTVDNGSKLQVNGTAYISDTLKMPNIISKSDTASYKPVVVDGNGNVFKMAAWNLPQLTRTAINDAGYSALTSDYLIALTSLTAPRTITLPAANAMNNHILIVKDESGAAGTNNITINVTAGGSIDGASSKVINNNYGVIEVYSNGSQWFTK